MSAVTCPHCDAEATLDGGKLAAHDTPWDLGACPAWGLTLDQAARVADVEDSQWVDECEAADLLRSGCVYPWLTAEEPAQLAGMAFGVDGYNDAHGWGDCDPGPCGHHCRDCPRCGY